jgi:hypothetical protein
VDKNIAPVKSVSTTPAANIPVSTTPVDTKQVDTTPVVATPEDTKQVDSTPANDIAIKEDKPSNEDSRG